MISRKKILSRSQSDLVDCNNIYEEDVWYNKDKLYQVCENFLVRKSDLFKIIAPIWFSLIESLD